MTTPSRIKIIFILTAVFAMLATSAAQAETYEWLKSPEHEAIFVYTDYNGCDFIADKLNETVKRTFSRSNIKATISSSLAFQTTGQSETPVYELIDEKLTGNNKIILHVYAKCIKYSSGFIYQFDLHFGVNNKKYSQALLYSTPRHSVVGVDSIMGINNTFRKLMQNVLDDYLSSNQ